MSKRKKFMASSSNMQGMSDSIRMVKNRDERYQDANVPLNYIVTDSNNPRKLLLSKESIMQGVKRSDADYARKIAELEMIQSLSDSIRKSGLINPITLYRIGENQYQIVAGECRFLAYLLLEKETIPARIFTTKPNDYELKLIQWEENTKRTDLTLAERVGNIQDLLRTYQALNPDSKLNSTVIREITGLSSSQAEYYNAILKGPEVVNIAIDCGDVNSLDKAYFLVSKQLSELERNEAIALVKSGLSLSELKKRYTKRKKAKIKTTPKVSLGSVKNAETIKIIIDAVLVQSKYSHYRERFSSINWKDNKVLSKSFKEFISILESNDVNT